MSFYDTIANLTIIRIKKEFPEVDWILGSQDNITKEGLHLFSPDEVEIVEAAQSAKCVYIHAR